MSQPAYIKPKVENLEHTTSELEADAEEATIGWPAGWSDFFTSQPARDRIAAKAEWASVTTIRRTAPLIAALAVFKGLSDDQVDALFGINA